MANSKKDEVRDDGAFWANLQKLEAKRDQQIKSGNKKASGGKKK